MAIVTNGGKIITHDNKIGTGEGCCCGEPCDPCAFSGGPETYFPDARLVGTWNTGGGATAFDWLAPADQEFAGYINRGWANNSRSPNSSLAPDTRVHATVWRWDGSTETCYTLDEFGDVVAAEVPSLRTCGDSACSAWFYGEPGSVNAVMSAREYRTLIDNPPPSDNQWYTFLYIEAGVGGPEVWYWAWIPYCTQTCGDVSLSSDGPSPGSLVIDTFTLTCEMGDACCAGNDEYPTYQLVDSECDGHNQVDYSAQTSASDVPPCLGACCYNDGTDDVCGGPMSKAECDDLSGTWHSGKSCDPDQQIVTLSFSSAAFGSGGGGIATAPIGTPGPITGVSITSPGSGYAQVVRVVPSVTASVAGGAGATFTANMASNGGSPQTWRVNGVTIAGAGAGYTDGAAVVFSTSDIEQTAAVATLQTARSQPTLTASVSGGSGATLTPTISSNGGSPETWGVASVSVSGTTSGYTDGASVAFSYGAGVTEQTAAVATIKTARTTPTITASVAGGSGASLTVTLSQSPTTPSDTALWHVDSVTVTDGGTGYTDGDPVTFTATDGTELVAAVGTVDVRPTLDAYVADTAGTGATLTPTLSQSGEYWTVSGVTITAAGTGYEVDQLILFTPTGGSTEVEAGVWLITSVDGSGGITGVAPPDEISSWGGVYDGGTGPIQRILISEPGDYYKATTSIARVVVTNGGQYYYYTGVPTGVTVTNGGQYYREDVSVAAVTVTVSQTLPSVGTGASITATVDSDKTSGTLGQVTGLTIASGGTGYVAVRPADDPCNLFP